MGFVPLVDNGWKLHLSDACPVFYLWTPEKEGTHRHLLILPNECYRVEKVISNAGITHTDLLHTQCLLYVIPALDASRGARAQPGGLRLPAAVQAPLSVKRRGA